MNCKAREYLDEAELLQHELSCRFGGEVTIHAVDPDNEWEGREVEHLLRAQYGDHKVDDWFTRLGKLTSPDEVGQVSHLVATSGDDVLAHIAFRYSWESGAVEILHPAISPRARREILLLSRLFNAVLTRQAMKQGWRAVYHFAETHHPITQFIAAKCFAACGTAIIPAPDNRHSGIKRTARPGGLVLMGRLFRQRALMERQLSIPSEYRPHVVTLYQALGENLLSSPDIFARVGEWETGRRSAPFGITLVEHSEARLYELRVHPSAIKSDAQFAHELARLAELAREGAYTTISIAIDDPFCGDFALTLETLGYRFSGLSSTLGEGDYLVHTRYSRTSLHEMNLYQPLSRALRAYLLDRKELPAVSLVT